MIYNLIINSSSLLQQNYYLLITLQPLTRPPLPLVIIDVSPFVPNFHRHSPCFMNPLRPLFCFLTHLKLKMSSFLPPCFGRPIIRKKKISPILNYNWYFDKLPFHSHSQTHNRNCAFFMTVLKCILLPEPACVQEGTVSCKNASLYPGRRVKLWCPMQRCASRERSWCDMMWDSCLGLYPIQSWKMMPTTELMLIVLCDIQSGKVNKHSLGGE